MATTSSAAQPDESGMKEADELLFKEIETTFMKIKSHFVLSSLVSDAGSNDNNKKYEEIVKLALEISKHLLNEEEGPFDKKDVDEFVEKSQPIYESRLNLESLGHVLFFLLYGEKLGDPQTFKSMNLPDDVDRDNDSSHSMKNRRKKKSTIFEILSYIGVPASLCSMTSALVAVDDEDMTYRYESIETVMHDLEAMIRDPQRFMYDICTKNISGRLEFPCKQIFGRAKETKQLLEVYDRVFRSSTRKSEIALVYGYPGVGKSSMVHKIEKIVTDSEGYFLTGEFQLYFLLLNQKILLWKM